MLVKCNKVIINDPTASLHYLVYINIQKLTFYILQGSVRSKALEVCWKLGIFNIGPHSEKRAT